MRGSEEAKDSRCSGTGEEVETSEQAAEEDWRGGEPPFGVEDVERRRCETTSRCGQTTEQELEHE